MGLVHSIGGDEGIRTLDALLAHTPLAGEHLRPLGHVSSCFRQVLAFSKVGNYYTHSALIAIAMANLVCQALCSRSKALCRERTASSMYFSSMTTDTLISEVEII